MADLGSVQPTTCTKPTIEPFNPNPHQHGWRLANRNF